MSLTLDHIGETYEYSQNPGTSKDYAQVPHQQLSPQYQERLKELPAKEVSKTPEDNGIKLDLTENLAHSISESHVPQTRSNSRAQRRFARRRDTRQAKRQKRRQESEKLKKKADPAPQPDRKTFEGELLEDIQSTGVQDATLTEPNQNGALVIKKDLTQPVRKVLTTRITDQDEGSTSSPAISGEEANSSKTASVIQKETGIKQIKEDRSKHKAPVKVRRVKLTTGFVVRKTSTSTTKSSSKQNTTSKAKTTKLSASSEWQTLKSALGPGFSKKQAVIQRASATKLEIQRKMPKVIIWKLLTKFSNQGGSACSAKSGLRAGESIV